MADKAIAVNGCTIEPVSPASGTINISSTPSNKVFLEDKGVFFKEIAFSVSGSNGGGDITDNNASGDGKFTVSYDSILDGSDQGVICEGDVVTVSVKGTRTSGSSTETLTRDIQVKITSAGQSSGFAV